MSSRPGGSAYRVTLCLDQVPALIKTPTYCRQCQGKSCPDCGWRGWVMTEMTIDELHQRLRPADDPGPETTANAVAAEMQKRVGR
jgi:hypothetical protein